MSSNNDKEKIMARATETTFEATIDYMERMASSTNGNPRYRVGFTNGTSYATAPDASVSYSLPNFRDGDRVKVTIMGKREQIVNVEPVE